MSTFKKTIFLTNKESTNKGMAILTMQKQQKGVFCTIKSYNIKTHTNLILGIKNDNNIIKQNINLENNLYNFLLNQEINLEKNLGCVLLDNSENKLTPLLWGSEKSDDYKNQIVSNLKSNIQKIQECTKNKCDVAIKKIEENRPQNDDIVNIEKNYNLNENINLFDSTSSPINNEKSPDISQKIQEIKNDLDNSYSNNIPQNNTQKCEEEIAQVTQLSNLFESSDEEINESIDNELSEHSSHKFYDMISEQLDELFDKYPREENLENLIENSKWAKIKYEDSDKFYVVGIIYLNNDIKYICYGVPGNYYSDPPLELKNYSQWLPTDTLSPYDNGYWVMYQDADTGENVLIN